MIEEEILQEEQNSKKKPLTESDEDLREDIYSGRIPEKEDKVLENQEAKDEDFELIKRTSRKIKTIYMKTKKII